MPLLQQHEQLIVIELDRDLIAPLAKRCQGHGALQIIQTDVLQFDFNSLELSHCHVVGNLPYNISTPLLFHLFEFDCVQNMTFMLQKEVVDRLCAECGDKDYSRLSVMAQYFCKLQKEFDVPAEAFYPAPKVTSSIISIERQAPLAPDLDPAVFAELVKQAFSQRRKMIRNNLKPLINEQQLAQLGIDPMLRPQDIALADYIDLSLFLQAR